MLTPYRVVSPYRPFAPESAFHQRLGPFDWPRALTYLARTVHESCHVETVALTDADTSLPIPAFRYRTEEPHLMLWLLEVARDYLASDDFNCDTVMVCPDVLVFGDLSPWFTHDLTVMCRRAEKYQRRPILNSVQWWSHAAKAPLVAFYTNLLTIARALPSGAIRWGADTLPFVQLLAPFDPISRRHGLTVHCVDINDVMRAYSRRAREKLLTHQPLIPLAAPLLDFRSHRKQDLFAYADAVRREVQAA